MPQQTRWAFSINRIDEEKLLEQFEVAAARGS